jgi:hypothetical protein
MPLCFLKKRQAFFFSCYIASLQHTDTGLALSPALLAPCLLSWHRLHKGWHTLHRPSGLSRLPRCLTIRAAVEWRTAEAQTHTARWLLVFVQGTFRFSIWRGRRQCHWRTHLGGSSWVCSVSMLEPNLLAKIGRSVNAGEVNTQCLPTSQLSCHTGPTAFNDGIMSPMLPFAKYVSRCTTDRTRQSLGYHHHFSLHLVELTQSTWHHPGGSCWSSHHSMTPLCTAMQKRADTHSRLS